MRINGVVSYHGIKIDIILRDITRIFGILIATQGVLESFFTISLVYYLLFL